MKRRKKLLVVEDDYSMRTILKEALVEAGYDVSDAKDGKDALEMLGESEYDLVITDLMMPRVDGMKLLEIVKTKYPGVGVFIITAYGTVERAVEALQKGAYDFITKPFSISHLKTRIENYFSYMYLKDENKELKRRLEKETKYRQIVGKSEMIKKILEQIDIVARTDLPVLIVGESGTGKELIAEAIHYNSDRNDGPFIRVNCSAIPETLFESTLFGHEKGAFTNAMRTFKGMFEEANGGTFLLDEISEIPITMQAKLLRVLQEGKITRVGSTREIPIDVRIVATTNQDMRQLVKKGKFREDLFFRLNVFPIHVPPLRERIEDVPLLVEHFMKKYCEKYNSRIEKEIDDDALEFLMRYDWPGNIRQLENVIKRAILLSAEESVIKRKHFHIELDEIDRKQTKDFDFVMSIAEMERKLIFTALRKTKNNRTHAAKLLGISVRTLRNKLNEYKKLGLIPEEFK
ncbi:MAG: sigma-54-dependent Fis family transcriptional regulator [Candidatus Marinimicrobia bacterium]|nr:sigma-54-dependent Fis family transcriptional regulator [Candidatus Neomarinimicrobiota bacterium]